MQMRVTNLADTPFDQIMDCFLAAFENYFVELPTDKEYYRKRWAMAKVNFKLSYGMFDEDNLVGFIINAVDQRNGEQIAFNTGTGVLPAYRGNKITKSIYKHALVDLKKHGISKCSLEVIKDNTIAVRSYEGIGFKITRNYKCYKGHLNINDVGLDDQSRLAKASPNWNDLLQLDRYSWDNQRETISNGNYDYFQVWNQEVLESYFIINSETGYIAQFDSYLPTQASWNRLFSHIQSVSESVKINNVDESLEQKISFLNHLGLKNTVDQYQMELIF